MESSQLISHHYNIIKHIEGAKDAIRLYKLASLEDKRLKFAYSTICFNELKQLEDAVEKYSAEANGRIFELYTAINDGLAEIVPPPGFA